MLPIDDPQVRVVLLHHVAVRLAQARPQDVAASGLAAEPLSRLRQLSAADLDRLASMRSLSIGIELDDQALQAGLRTVALYQEAQALESYFIRHGASTTLMSRLFKLRRKLTLQRRRELGVQRPAGRVRLPDHGTRERIFRAWLGSAASPLRLRYHQLHLAFPALAIAVLEAVVREYEEAA